MPYPGPQKDIQGISFAEQKKKVYQMIQHRVKGITGERISLEAARELFDLVIENTVVSAAAFGSFRLNQGLGTLKTKVTDGGLKRLPDGKEVAYPAKMKINFVPGLRTEEILEIALKHRS